MTTAFETSLPATGPGAWRADGQPDYRGGERFAYLSGVALRSEAGGDLTTEALVPLTTE